VIVGVIVHLALRHRRRRRAAGTNPAAAE